MDKSKAGKNQGLQKGRTDQPRGNAAKKRKFRHEKYKAAFGNRAEGHGFAEATKMKTVHQYKRWLSKERAKAAAGSSKTSNMPSSMSTQHTAEESDPDSGSKKKRKKLHRYQKAMAEAEDKKTEKMANKKAVAEQQQGREEALKKYEDKKKKKHKLLLKKTFRGQPSMGSRMEILLQQIENKR